MIQRTVLLFPCNIVSFKKKNNQHQFVISPYSFLATFIKSLIPDLDKLKSIGNSHDDNLSHTFFF